MSFYNLEKMVLYLMKSDDSICVFFSYTIQFMHNIDNNYLLKSLIKNINLMAFRLSTNNNKKLFDTKKINHVLI